jgi:D-methionine transport system ATP-binding protein
MDTRQSQSMLERAASAYAFSCDGIGAEMMDWMDPETMMFVDELRGGRVAKDSRNVFATEANHQPSADDPIVRVVGLKKSFGQVRALNGISFEVQQGEILGIIGRSGAGKSTLIRCLNGLEKPDRGQVEILGSDIVPLTERGLQRVRGRIGMIFQHFNLLSAKTVAQNVALPLKLAGVAAAERRSRVLELLDLVGLADKADVYPAKLSGGQKQRVGIARALAARPALLLSDEATSALDPETTLSILGLLRDINRRLGLTIVLITHEMSVIRNIADRVIVLEDGAIAEQGEVAQIFSDPKVELTRRLIGDELKGLPPRLRDRLQGDWSFGAHLVLHVRLTGKAAQQPVLAMLARDMDLLPVVLHGEIRQVQQQPIASFVVAIGDADRTLAERIENYLTQYGSHMKVLGYVQQLA